MNCSVCGNKVDDFTKGCPTCGNYANSAINHCYNCGRQNSENYNICAGCKTPLVAKQNGVVCTLLSFFVFFPFLAFYAGRKKEALLRTAIALIPAFLMPLAFNGENFAVVIGFIIFISWGFLFVWSIIDMVRIFTLWPKPYTNGRGLILH